MPAGIPLVIAAMQHVPDELDVQTQACATLAAFADNSSSRDGGISR